MIDTLPFNARLAAGCLAGCVALTTTACGGDASGPASGWTATVDTLSNGAVLVTHAPPADPAPTWRLEPELRIGAADGEGPEVFGRVADLAVHPDGRIAVLDAQAQEIRVFGPDGAHLATYGREGAGPGEYRAANGLVFGPDGLLRVPDMRNARLSLVHLDSGYVASHPFHPSYMEPAWSGVVDSAGRAWSVYYFRGTGEGDPGSVAYVAHGPDGALVDTLGRPRELPPPGERPGTWDVSRDDGTALALLGVPFYADEQYVLSPALRIWSTPGGDPSYRLIRWSPPRDTALIVEVERSPVPVDMAAADSIIRGYEERFGTSLDRSKIPEAAPAVRDFFFDDDGRLWVRVRTPADDSLRTFDAFDPDAGAYLGTLATDLRLEATPPPTIRGDTVWAVIRDELDVPFVVRGRLVSQPFDRGDE